MGGLSIVEVNLLPSKVGKTDSLVLSRRNHPSRLCVSVRAQVTHLVIKRPQFFHFKPGDYVYINIPEIAKYEWHPFTISSAPEQSGTCGGEQGRDLGSQQ